MVKVAFQTKKKEEKKKLWIEVLEEGLELPLLGGEAEVEGEGRWILQTMSHTSITLLALFN